MKKHIHLILNCYELRLDNIAVYMLNLSSIMALPTLTNVTLLQCMHKSQCNLTVRGIFMLLYVCVCVCVCVCKNKGFLL